MTEQQQPQHGRGSALRVAIIVGGVMALMFVMALVIGLGLVLMDVGQKGSSSKSANESAENHAAKPESRPQPPQKVASTTINLEGPGDKATPPTYLERGKLVVMLTHDPPAGLSTTWADYSKNNVTVHAQDEDGKNVQGGFIWKSGDYSGSHSVAIPESSYYTIQVEGLSPWTVDVTLYPAE